MNDILIGMFKELSPFMKNVIIVYFMLNFTTALLIVGYIIIKSFSKFLKCNVKKVDLDAGPVKLDIEINDGVK